MDERRRVEVVEVARQLLARFQAEHPQWTDDRTPVDELVAWYGLDVGTFHPDDHQKGTYGFLEPGEPLIWLCRGLSETFRRFTLAHELGHAILHQESSHVPSDLPMISRDDPCQQPDVLEEVTTLAGQEYMEEALGIGMQYDPRGERELEANLFAAELLMPLERVRALYLVEQISPHQLAATFDVSNAALLNRLAGLLTGVREDVETNEQANQEQSGQQEEQQITPVKAKRYDAFQQAAIEAVTPALIVAGPGSGKTSTLVGRTEYLVQGLGVPAEQILALTFSRKAAQEMRERLQAALGETKHVPTVSTFHAFCADVLRSYGSLLGLRQNFALVDETEGYFLLRQQARAMRLRHYRNLSYPDLYFPALLKAISRARDELVSPEQYRALAEAMLKQAQDDEARQKAEKALEVAAVYALYEAGLQERGDTDFGGLIMQTVRLFTEFPEVLHEQQAKYQHILVDEFQDINRASGILLRHLAGEERRVWVVGDANQAIYGFRGASPANIASFEQDYPGAAILPLSHNYRSRPDIVSLSESFRYQQLELGQEVEPVKNQPVRLTALETYVTVAKADDEASELAGLLADIRRKLAAGYSYQDIVVLCRTRSHARKIMRALALAGLPVIETGSMLGQEHIKDVLSIVLLLADSSGMGILRAARLREHPLSQQDIEALLLGAREAQCSLYSLMMRGEIPPALSAQGQQAFSHLSTIVRSLHQTSNVWSLLAQYLFIETSLLRDLLCAPVSKLQQSLLDDYSNLLALARRYDLQQAEQLRKLREAREMGETGETGEAGEEQQESGDNPPLVREQAKGFLDYLSILLMLHQDGGNRQQGEGEETPEVIRVMTVHASKGLEFPVVYLPGLVQQRFPIKRQASLVAVPEGMLPPESEGEAAHDSGEACLFYVGVTRARDALVLSYSTHYGKRNYKRSPYVDALLAGLEEERITQLEWRSRDEYRYLADAADDLIPASQPGESFVQAMQPATLNVTDIEAYQRCPRQYAYSNIYRFRREAGAYVLFRRATQKTVEELQKGNAGAQFIAPDGQEPFAEPVAVASAQQEAHDLYTRHWQELGGHLTPFASFYEQHGHEVVDMLLHKLATDKGEQWGERQSYSVDIDGRTVLVPVDRVEAAQEQGQGQGQEKKPVRFVRTGFGKRKEKPAAETREMLYARALRQHHPNQQLELHFHNLSTGETVPIALTEKKEQKLYHDLVDLILGMERHEYPINPDPFRCPSCPYFLICPA